MAERKSAVREAEVEIDESSRTRRERMQLAALFFGVIAIIALMFVVSAFLSNKGTDWIVPTSIFGATGLITVGLYFGSRRIKLKKA